MRVRVRVLERDSAIFEKGGYGCSGTRRLKNIFIYIFNIFLSMGKIVAGNYVAQGRFGIRVRVRVRRDSAIKKLLKILLFIFSIYFYY